MDRQRFLKTLFLGGAGLLVAPLLPKPSAPPGKDWLYVGHLKDLLPNHATQSHTHDGPSVDGDHITANHRHMGIGFFEDEGRLYSRLQEASL